MGALACRLTAIFRYLVERARHGAPEFAGSAEGEVCFILDGVGRFHFAPVLIRRMLRECGSDMGTYLYDWQFGLVGEIWTDLMWLHRNRVMGAKLARRLLTFHRTHPHTRIHLIAYSGGAGIAVFALEALRGRQIVETLLIPCPALSPNYNLGPALRAVRRAYALVSRRDYGILGMGTRLFGTTDRRFIGAAGWRGFRRPTGLRREDDEAYDRLGEIHWEPSLKKDGHAGGHTGWAAAGFLRHHFLPILHGEPLLAVHAVAPGTSQVAGAPAQAT